MPIPLHHTCSQAIQTLWTVSAKFEISPWTKAPLLQVVPLFQSWNTLIVWTSAWHSIDVVSVRYIPSILKMVLLQVKQILFHKLNLDSFWHQPQLLSLFTIRSGRASNCFLLSLSDFGGHTWNCPWSKTVLQWVQNLTSEDMIWVTIFSRSVRGFRFSICKTELAYAGLALARNYRIRTEMI